MQETDITDIGTRLSKERENKGLTFEKISDDLKIQKKYLEAIEKGNFDILPGEVYLKVFLKAYADYLGINGREILEEYKNIKRVPARIEHEFLMHHPKIRDKRKRFPVKFEFTREMKLGSLVLLGLILTIFIISGIRRCAAMPQRPGAGALLETSNMPRLILEADVTGDCWFEITKDNEAPVKRMLSAGFKGEWTANEAFYVLVGDKQKIKLTFNGKEYPIENLNGDNKVVTLTLKREENKIDGK